MDQKELILKAMEYISDIPSRVDDFLVREKFKKEWGKDFNIYSRYYAGCDPITPEKKKLPKTREEWRAFMHEYEDFRLAPENGGGKERPYYKFLDGFEDY
jgi:hypothetical protein